MFFGPRKQLVTPCRFLGEETAGAWQPATVFDVRKGVILLGKEPDFAYRFLHENTPGARQPVTVFWLKRKLVAKGMLEAY